MCLPLSQARCLLFGKSGRTLLQHLERRRSVICIVAVIHHSGTIMLELLAGFVEFLEDKGLEFLKLLIGISSFFLFQWYDI